jgi:hypothetical protein
LTHPEVAVLSLHSLISLVLICCFIFFAFVIQKLPGKSFRKNIPNDPTEASVIAKKRSRLNRALYNPVKMAAQSLDVFSNSVNLSFKEFTQRRRQELRPPATNPMNLLEEETTE